VAGSPTLDVGAGSVVCDRIAATIAGMSSVVNGFGHRLHLG